VLPQGKRITQGKTRKGKKMKVNVKRRGEKTLRGWEGTCWDGEAREGVWGRPATGKGRDFL